MEHVSCTTYRKLHNAKANQARPIHYIILFLHDLRDCPETAVSLFHQKRLGSGSEPTAQHINYANVALIYYIFNTFATRIPGHVQPVRRPCGTWMHYAMRDVKDMGQQMGYRSLEWNWPKEAMNIPIWAGIVLLMEPSCFNLLVNS